MLKASPSSGSSQTRNAYSAIVPATSGTTATSHAIVPCRCSPALNVFSSHSAQLETAARQTLRSLSGCHCSSSSAAMMAITAMAQTKIAQRLLRRSRSEMPVEIHQHAGRSSPDVIVAVGNREVVHRPALEFAAVPLVVRRVEQERKRHFERLVYLVRVEAQLERHAHQSHHRRDAKAGACVIVGKPPQQLDASPRETDFLLGFAQRR